MKIAILRKNGFSLEDIAMPVIGDDEVLVRTLACGVCSGDLFIYKNRKELASSNSRLGHEASGEVAEVGKHVTNIQVGDIVTSLAYAAYAEYFVTMSNRVIKLPDNVDPVYTLGEPVACCVHAFNRFGIQSGDKIALVGCGFMGLICQQLVQLEQPGFICAIDPVSDRREMSLKFGANVAYDPLEKAANEILAAHGQFDIVIEAAGTQNALDLCTDLVAQHGRIILVGYHQSAHGMRTVNMQQWNYKAIDVVNGHVRRENEKIDAMSQGMQLLEQEKLTTEPLVTVYDFEDTAKAFHDLDTGKHGLYKAVLKMGSI